MPNVRGADAQGAALLRGWVVNEKDISQAITAAIVLLIIYACTGLGGCG